MSKPEQPMTDMELNAEKVHKAYPAAFAFANPWLGYSICNGTKTVRGDYPIRIQSVDFYPTIGLAWAAAAKAVEDKR